MDREHPTVKKKKAAIKDLKKTIKAIMNGGTVPTSEGEKAATEGVGPLTEPVTPSTNPANLRETKNTPETDAAQYAGRRAIDSCRRNAEENITTAERRNVGTTANGRAQQRAHPTPSAEYNHTSSSG